MDPAAAISTEDELKGYFEPGAKPRERWGMGLEYERLGVFADTGLCVPYEGPVSVESLFHELSRNHGWTIESELGRPLGLKRGEVHITLEPGGQVEMSGAVHRALSGLRDEVTAFVAEIDAISLPMGIAWLGLGLHPFSALADIQFIPKSRYRIMSEYLPRRGSRAHVMMKQTASIQLNLDYGSEGDAMEKLRTAMAVSPLITALYAHSPLTEGRLNGMMSYRAWAWRDTDPDRCGLLPFAFKDGAGFQDYLDYALDVPMFFVARGDTYTFARGMSFRKFIRKGFEGMRPTLADFELHLTTLFPEVRLKRYLEIRGMDSGDPASCLSLAALWKGLLYDGAARRSAWELVREMSFREREALLDAAIRLGPLAPVPGGRTSRTGSPLLARDLLIDLVRLARQGLNNQGAPDEAAHLDRLDRRLGGEGGCPAYRLAAAWEGDLQRDPRKLITYLTRAGADHP